MEIAISQQLQLLEIQTDSQVLVKIINNDISSPNLRTMVYDCRLFLKNLKKCAIKHIYRESNSFVNLLAKHILPNEKNLAMFYQPPSFSFTTF